MIITLIFSKNWYVYIEFYIQAVIISNKNTLSIIFLNYIFKIKNILNIKLLYNSNFFYFI
jgi:hypothetical protein